jgi:DNA-binding transcriptional LysR family regulator
MSDVDVDLNLLGALDVLLAEGSVTGAARRLGLSASAMSRTLARLRSATGDPLLVRAGRGLVPTPRAAELRDRVHELTRDARAVLRPHITHVDIATLALTFTIRASEGFLEFLAGPVVAAITQAAPRVRLQFAAKPDRDARPLREGLIDLEIGLLGTFAPEIRTQFLFYDRLVGVVRAGHPLLASATVTPERYAACHHVAASREGHATQPIDAALESLGLRRTVMVVVPGSDTRMPCGSPASRIWSRSCRNPASAAACRASPPRRPVSKASNSPSPCPGSRSRPCGIPAWTPTRPIAGCVRR